MYVNAAYLNNHLSAIVDETRPLLVTSCGNYRVKTREIVETKRMNGRMDYQLLYIASGKGHFFTDGKEKIVTAGNIVLYKPGEPQYYVYYKEDKIDVYWIHFTGYDAERILDQYNISNKGNILNIGTSPDYQWLFGQIIQELQLCKPKYEELLSLQLRNILILVSRSIENEKKISDAIEKEVSFAMHRFRTHYKEEINIDEYAKSRNFSVCWFIRCFKQITGQTPLQYILSVRIANAQSLLESTDYSIAEIAAQVGYENSLYFSRLFHKQTGMPPKEYRKSCEKYQISS